MAGAFARELPAERPRTPDAALGASFPSAMAAKYKNYHPGPTDWDAGGLHRLEPRVMLAWRDMPIATRWRFPHDD